MSGSHVYAALPTAQGEAEPRLLVRLEEHDLRAWVSYVDVLGISGHEMRSWIVLRGAQTPIEIDLAPDVVVQQMDAALRAHAQKAPWHAGVNAPK